MFFAFILGVFSLFFRPSWQATSAEWRARSIYQIVTDRFALTKESTASICNTSLGKYCGGTWQGIKGQLDYIQGMGFDAIWISPITKQFEQHTAENESYHGYWQQDLHHLNEHFGTADDLKDLATEIHRRDMFLMIDVVVGHVAWPGPRSSVNYSVFEPFNDERFFHPSDCFASDAGTNQTMVQDCWLGDDTVSLPDLRTEDDDIAKVLYSFVADTVKNFSADGLRVDSVVNLSPDLLPGLSKAAGVYAIGEVLQGNTTAACSYQDLMDGFLNYPQYFPLVRLLQGTDEIAEDLVEELLSIRTGCKDPSLLGTFSENHDNPRLASYTDDMSLASNAMAFDIMYDGIPVIYYGQEQHFSGTDSPMNREPLWPSGYNTSAPLYKLATTLNSLRSQVIQSNDSYLGYLSDIVYSDEHNIAFRKGYAGNQVVTVINNNGAIESNFTIQVPETGFIQGAKVTDVVSCTSVKAGVNGTLTATISNGMPVVYVLDSIIEQTGVCNPAKAKALASASAAALATATATNTATATITGGGIVTATVPRSSGGSSITKSSTTGLVACFLLFSML